MRYNPQDKMLSLIADDYRLIQVLSRFGIPMGFGDNSVEDVCRLNHVDHKTFLAVVNFMVNDDEESDVDTTQLKVESLLHYLKQSHVYFLEFCLPSIRRKLLDAIHLNDSDVSFLIIKLFDEYVSEVRAHMEDEETQLFKHINSLLEGEYDENHKLETYSSHHENVGSKLKELKNIIIRYCPQTSKTNLLNAALYDIYRCEEELRSHSDVEDYLLMPALTSLERKFISK